MNTYEIPYSKERTTEQPSWYWLAIPSEQSIGSLSCACALCGKYQSLYLHNVSRSGVLSKPVRCSFCNERYNVKLLGWPSNVCKHPGTNVTELTHFEE